MPKLRRKLWSKLEIFEIIYQCSSHFIIMCEIMMCVSRESVNECDQCAVIYLVVRYWDCWDITI